MSDQRSASQVYRAIIDQLTNETRYGGGGHHVAKSNVYSKAPDHQEYNDFIQALSPQHRNLLSRMLNDERDSTIHDVLAVLTWWIECRDVGLSFHGEPMPIDESGMGLHGDYVGRRDGWDWPNRD
jgi:hypothetical protein